MESQLHQHGPQLLLRDVLSSNPLLDFVTQAHLHAAAVPLVLGCHPALLREPHLERLVDSLVAKEKVLLFGNQRINQALRFELSLCRGLAQLVN